MKIPSTAALAVAIALTLPASLTAKGRTVKITISTVDQAAPVEINDPAIGQFHVWDGPGTYVNDFIIDWSKGAVEHRPNALRRYRVAFYTGDEETKPRLSYVVLYEYDPAAGKGYVYLPGKADEGYALNTRSIYRGLEGDWFVATSSWQEYVAPIISKQLDNRQR
jgi:hypothetical protein